MILGSGSVAKHFIEWVSRNMVAKNQYYATCYKTQNNPEDMGSNITLFDVDPTSFSKLNNIMRSINFSNVFIVMNEKEDAKYVLKNIRLIDTKMRVIFMNFWDDEEIGNEHENITVIHSDGLLAAHLYDQLPNVPLVAQNVGLGQGEIMEVHVPFGSSYAYRHIGSILQGKWKIAALYRDKKQILCTNATMIRPNDTLLILGKPSVLDGVYKTINKRIGLFPEPFGKDIYLLLDFRFDQKKALAYIKDALFLRERLENKSLYIRVIYPNNFDLLTQIKSYGSEKVTVAVAYENDDIKSMLEHDIYKYHIGLVMNSISTFEAEGLKDILYSLKKLVYLFGIKSLAQLKNCVVLMNEQDKMESISATAFDICETLNLGLTLGDFDPEGDFESKKMIVEHYETLTHIFNMDMKVEQKIANPIRELSNMDNILQIAPFEQSLNTDNFMKLISTKVQDFILTTTKHPKLLVPFAVIEG